MKAKVANPVYLHSIRLEAQKDPTDPVGISTLTWIHRRDTVHPLM